LESFGGSDGQHVAPSQGSDGRKVTCPYFAYSLFGLRILANQALSGISSVELPVETFLDFASSPSDDRTVKIMLQTSLHDDPTQPWLSEELCYVTDETVEGAIPALRMWNLNDGKFLRLDYFDDTKFWLDRQGTRVWATWPANLTVADTATYLLGPVLGLLLRLRGVTCLHASAVSLGDCAIAFVGSEGAGKSTTAAALAQEGWGILSDDVVALAEIDGVFHVHPAYPYLCLWPESVAAIYGSAEVLPRLSPNYEKRCLSLGKNELLFEARSLPLKAIFILGERRPDPAPQLKMVSAQQAIVELVANTFATNVLESEMRAKEFATLGRLVPNVRIREVFAHQDPARLPDLCRLIREDVENINDSVSEHPNFTNLAR
jgi:hypothetical protein